MSYLVLRVLFVFYEEIKELLIVKRDNEPLGRLMLLERVGEVSLTMSKKGTLMCIPLLAIWKSANERFINSRQDTSLMHLLKVSI